MNLLSVGRREGEYNTMLARVESWLGQGLSADRIVRKIERIKQKTTLSVFSIQRRERERKGANSIFQILDYNQ